MPASPHSLSGIHGIKKSRYVEKSSGHFCTLPGQPSITSQSLSGTNQGSSNLFAFNKPHPERNTGVEFAAKNGGRSFSAMAPSRNELFAYPSPHVSACNDPTARGIRPQSSMGSNRSHPRANQNECCSVVPIG